MVEAQDLHTVFVPMLQSSTPDEYRPTFWQNAAYFAAFSHDHCRDALWLALVSMENSPPFFHILGYL